MPQDNVVQKYEVTEAGWLDGTPRKVGELLTMTPVQAKYLLLNGQIKAFTPAPKPAAPKPTTRMRGNNASQVIVDEVDGAEKMSAPPPAKND